MKRRHESTGADLFAELDGHAGRVTIPAVALSAGEYSDFGDFANIMQVLEHVWLGNGERARKLLEVRGEPMGKTAAVEIGTAGLEFEDLRLENHL